MQARPRRSALLASVAAPAIAVLVAIAACGGAVENTDLFEPESSSGSPGVTPSPTTPTVEAGPAPTTPAPKPPVPGKPCTVSFKKDVIQVFEDHNCSSVTCHGGVLNRPRIDVNNATTTYQAITTYTLSTGKAYVVVGGTDAQASGMYCNFRGDCGPRMPPGDKLQSNDLEVIDEWLACGAPNN